MKKLVIAITLLISSIASNAQVLNVPEVIQIKDNWCWAGCSKSILNYFADSVQQCEIAEYARTVITWHSFGTVNCCTNANAGCNYWNYNWGNPGSIQDILVHFNAINNVGQSGPLTLDEITNEISQDHPFVEHWSWAAGGGHFVVGHGIVGSTIYYMNPWFGEGLHFCTYDWMKTDGDHTWDSENILTSTPFVHNLGFENVDNTASNDLIYPIPSTGLVSLKSNAGNEVKIYSMTGSLVYNTTLKSDMSQIDLSQLAKGMYIVKLSATDGNKFMKLILQ